MTTWTKEAVQVLIDAYKNEPCLYQTKSPNYHNKYLRNESLKRICAIVNTVRPNTTEKECSIKFYNLRNQFNSENAKVRASMKSGISSENVYKPNLWYYDTLKFLEEHIISRKSKTSTLPNTQKNTPISLNHDSQEQLEESQDSILNIHEILFEDDNINNKEDLSNNNDESQLNTSSSLNINMSSTSSLCSSSSAQSSNVYDMSQSPAIICNPKKRKLNDDVYIKAIESIAESIKVPSTPVNVITDPVDTCMSFLSSLLKKIQSRDIQLNVMNTLVQTVMNASVTDLEQAKR